MKHLRTDNSIFSRILSFLPMAVCVALLPPLWAAAACIAGVTTGPVALITAGFFAASGGKEKTGLPISAGLLLGDVWAMGAQRTIAALSAGGALSSPDAGSIPGGFAAAFSLPLPAAVFVTLAIFGFAAVLIAAAAGRHIFLPAWLAGWAIGMTIMDAQGSTFRAFGMTALAMLVGVWYVGIFQNRVQALLEGCTSH